MAPGVVDEVGGQTVDMALLGILCHNAILLGGTHLELWSGQRQDAVRRGAPHNAVCARYNVVVSSCRNDVGVSKTRAS